MQIKKERLEVLEETIRRMKEDDYDDMPFADTDKLVFLLKTKEKWYREIKNPIIGMHRNYTEEQKKESEIIKKENQRIKDTYIKPLEFKIKILEIENMLFLGICEMKHFSEDVYQRVYPEEQEDEK